MVQKRYITISLGIGGYKIAMPKCDQVEAVMRATRITPATDGWPLRSRNWILEHGSSYEAHTWELIHNNENIIVPHKDLIEAIKEVQEGKFHIDRENDELTMALKNKELPGRTRGFGATVSWRTGFFGDDETNRSRSISNKREANLL
jgi:hypothetical protein